MHLAAQGRAEADRRAAEAGGWTELARLEQQAVRAAARADRLKQLLYFPEAKGYRCDPRPTGCAGHGGHGHARVSAITPAC